MLIISFQDIEKMKKVNKFDDLNRLLDYCVFVVNNFALLPSSMRRSVVLQLWLSHCRISNIERRDSKKNR